MHFTSESASMRFSPRSTRLRPLTKDMASKAASSMCCNRIRSSFRILNLSLAEDLVPEVAAEIRGGPQIDLATDQLGELPFDPRHLNQTDPVTGLKFDKEIHVAVGTGLSPQCGAEESQPADAPPLAELRQIRLRDVER